MQTTSLRKPFESEQFLDNELMLLKLAKALATNGVLKQLKGGKATLYFLFHFTRKNALSYVEIHDHSRINGSQSLLKVHKNITTIGRS